MNGMIRAGRCAATLTAASAAFAGDGGWVTFADETAARLPVPLNDPSLSTADDSEKSYAFGDVDQDGDLDLVVARRPAYQFGGLRNVLFMNEGTAEGHALDGVLVDRTSTYVAASDVPGDQGFLAETSDRDIAIADLNNDGWPEIITAVAWGEGQPVHGSHPRVYRNLGGRAGVWLGFRYEQGRIPDFGPTLQPRFGSVSAGDVTGDGFADLYFSDFDRSEFPFSNQPDGVDLNNRLLINDGTGAFADETTSRLTFEMYDSAYGAAGAIADMNGDGANDIIKQSSNTAPFHIAIIYNDPGNVGFFDLFQIVYGFPQNGYYVSPGDLNGDGKLDLIVTDNGIDRYLLNQGNAGNGTASFTAQLFPSTVPGVEFGGNSYTADLDGDGHNDVVITDMDVDVPGCGRRMHLFHNLATTPTPTFDEPDVGIPLASLQGTHDVAVFDINGDGGLDLVIGRCAGASVWINQNPPPPLLGDLDRDGDVDVDDLVTLIVAWGPCVHCPPSCTGDLDEDCDVDVDDLVTLIVNWSA